MDWTHPNSLGRAGGGAMPMRERDRKFKKVTKGQSLELSREA